VQNGSEIRLALGRENYSLLQINKEIIDGLRQTFKWLNPTLCGMRNSFGFGDRIGCATAGHIQALKGHDFFPIFAQQSARELERTGRSFLDVLNDAVLGCFKEGYRGNFGADADHIKDLQALGAAADAGYSYFTIDPSDKIEKASMMDEDRRKKALDEYWAEYGLPFLNKTYNIGRARYTFSEGPTVELVLTYAAAIKFVEQCWQFLKTKINFFDFEVSVDETQIPTTPLAHIFIAEHLRNRGIKYSSIALRFPGRFEKGIDYVGNINGFETALEAHVLIRDYFKDYKISLHSGSDKFAIYPSFRKIVGSGFHIKTSGTSWIEAIKAVAKSDFGLFSEIVRRAIETFQVNAASYEISADPAKITISMLKEDEIDNLFANPDFRQILHISYGAILSDSALSGQLRSTLVTHEDIYAALLKEHLGRHLALLR
jgi:hypothetical protein